jgi:signal transduction histidine kinase
VQAAGGRIELDSRPGEGTRFRLQLPLHEAAEAAQASPANR